MREQLSELTRPLRRQSHQHIFEITLALMPWLIAALERVAPVAGIP
jgi:hypothetical protein